MSEKDKDEVFFDLCKRLPNQLKCKLYDRDEPDYLNGIYVDKIGVATFSFKFNANKVYYIDQFKPYLRSQLFDNEKTIIKNLGFQIEENRIILDNGVTDFNFFSKLEDFIYSRGIDVRGFIKRGLALEHSIE